MNDPDATDRRPDTDAPEAADDGADETAAAAEPLDLAAIERDLADVDAALRRLDDGSYWTDEVTGEPIPDEVLAVRPAARRVDTAS